MQYFAFFTNHQSWEWEYSALFAALTSPALRSWYVWSLSKPVSHQQQLHSLGNRILFVLMPFWRCWAVSSGSQDVEKDEEKQNFTCSLQLTLFYPVFPVGRWQFRHFLPHFPPLFYWDHLSTFLQYLQGAEAAAQTLLCVFQGAGSAGKEWESRQRLFRGDRAQVEDSGHTWLSPGPLKAASPPPSLFLSSLLSASHPLLFL